MWGVLRRPRWLGYLALAVLFGVITAGLGAWQWDRHEQKVERRALIEANYFGDSVPLDDVLPAGGDLDPADGWTKVSATGRYATDLQHLVRNRPYDGIFGYEVLVPLLLADGTAVAVDRGWVPNAPTAQQLPDVPAAPQGEVTVTGWVRPSEPDLGRDRVEGQLASISVDVLAEATGAPLRQGYLVLEAEVPAPAERPEPLAEPDTGLGSHLAYALQWWLTVPVGLLLVGVMARREAQEEQAQTGLPAGAGGASTAPVSSSSSVRTRTRPKKVRIWDEEDA